MLRRDLSYGRIFFSPDDGNGNGGGGDGNGDGKPNGDQKPEGDQKPKADDPLAGLTEAQKEAIQRHVDSAAAKARKDGEKAGLTKAQQDAAAKAEEERVAKEQADKIASGEFETVKTELEGRVKGAEDKLTKANAVIAGVITERLTALEAIGDKELLEAFPKEADPLDQLAWLDDPRTKRAMANATEDKKVTDAQGKPKVPKTPKPNGDGNPQDSDAAKRRAQRNYTG